MISPLDHDPFVQSIDCTTSTNPRYLLRFARRRSCHDQVARPLIAFSLRSSITVSVLATKVLFRCTQVGFTLWRYWSSTCHPHTPPTYKEIVLTIMMTFWWRSQPTKRIFYLLLLCLVLYQVGYRYSIELWLRYNEDYVRFNALDNIQ